MKKAARLIGLILILATGLFADPIVWKSKEDFNRNFNWNVSYNGALTLNGFVSYGKYSMPSVPFGTIYHARLDPRTGILIFAPPFENAGLTLVYPDGRSFTYRAEGLYDTTNDFMGTIVSTSVRLPTNHVLDAIMDPETDDLIVSGFADAGSPGQLFIIHSVSTPAASTMESLTRPAGALVTANPFVLNLAPQGDILTGGYWSNRGDRVGIFNRYSFRSTLFDEQGVYDGSNGVKTLITDHPRLGLTSQGNMIFHISEDKDGNLLAGSIDGLSILLKDPVSGTFYKSVSYRNTGVYDTTHSAQGVLMNSTPALAGAIVKEVAQGIDGSLYVATEDHDYPGTTGGASRIFPDGRIMLFPFPITGYASGISTDATGSVYISFFESRMGAADGGLQIWNPDNTGVTNLKSDMYPFIPDNRVQSAWMDTHRNLFVLGADRLNMVPAGAETAISGSTESNVISLVSNPVTRLKKRAQSGNRDQVVFQVRTGDSSAYSRWDFNTALEATTTLPATVHDGMLTIQLKRRNGYGAIDLGFPSDYFPAGSMVKIRGRIQSGSGQGYAQIYVDGGAAGESDFWTVLSKSDQWQDIAFSPGAAFSKISFYTEELSLLEIDSIEIINGNGWTSWKTQSGSALDIRAGDQYLQWRALFKGSVGSLPKLLSVTLK